MGDVVDDDVRALCGELERRSTCRCRCCRRSRWRPCPALPSDCSCRRSCLAGGRLDRWARNSPRQRTHRRRLTTSRPEPSAPAAGPNPLRWGRRGSGAAARPQNPQLSQSTWSHSVSYLKEIWSLRPVRQTARLVDVNVLLEDLGDPEVPQRALRGLQRGRRHPPRIGCSCRSLRSLGTRSCRSFLRGSPDPTPVRRSRQPAAGGRGSADDPERRGPPTDDSGGSCPRRPMQAANTRRGRTSRTASGLPRRRRRSPDRGGSGGSCPAGSGRPPGNGAGVGR